MPIIRSQLQRSLGRQLGHHTANFRSCSRPFGACVAPHSRQLHCLASGEASNNGESGSRGQGFGKPLSSQQKKQKLQVSNTADALLRSLGEVSSSSGRDAGSKNLVLGTSDSVAKWRQLDEKVNQYPGHRDFKAIGSGGEDFKQTIVRAVEDVVGPVKEDRVVQRPSSQGKFISITLKDVKVHNPDQVLAVYEAMRRDKRLRYYL
ncbi:hypothetical protein WJX82_006610 [Trebouxia sp. C0006]